MYTINGQQRATSARMSLPSSCWKQNRGQPLAVLLSRICERNGYGADVKKEMLEKGTQTAHCEAESCDTAVHCTEDARTHYDCKGGRLYSIQ